MKSEWRIGYEKYNKRKRRYVVYRLLDRTQADCDDNREMHDHLWSEEEAKYLVSVLNAEYDNLRT